jgi:hypothetical protein
VDREKKMDLDEPVNVDLEPDDALRVLLGEERREIEPIEDLDDDAE